MAISEMDRKRIDAWCAARIPAGLMSEIRIEAKFRGNSVSIVDRRPPFHPSHGAEWSETRIAKLTWDPPRNSWELFAIDRNNRLLPYSQQFEIGRLLIDVLAEIDGDPTAIFWG